MNPLQINKTELSIAVTPPIDTAAYVAGDVLFIPVAVNVLDNVHIGKKLRIRINNITVIDMGNIKAAFDLHFFNAVAAPASYGALNAACALSAADAAAGFRETIVVATYVDVVAPVSRANPAITPFVITLPAGQKFIWLAATTRGTPTYPAATNLKIILGVEIINDVHA